MGPPPELPAAAAPSKALGDEAYARRDYTTAIGHYTRALVSAPNAVLFGNRSACHAQRRCFSEALDDARRGLDLCPTWSKLFHRRAHALFHLGYCEEAMASIDEGLKKDPEDAALGSAKVFLEKATEPVKAPPGFAPPRRRRAPPSAAAPGADGDGGKEDVARPVGSEGRFQVVHDRVAERCEPSTSAAIVGVQFKGALVTGTPHDVAGAPWLRLRSSWMLMDGASVGLGRLVEPVDEEVELAKAEELRELGNTRFREKQYQAAGQAYSDSIARLPTDARTWSNRAACHMKILQEATEGMPVAAVSKNSLFAKAANDLKEALVVDRGYAKAYARLGQLHLMAGETVKALENFQAGLREDPDSADCAAGRDRCKGIAGSGR